MNDDLFLKAAAEDQMRKMRTLLIFQRVDRYIAIMKTPIPLPKETVKLATASAYNPVGARLAGRSLL